MGKTYIIPEINGEWYIEDSVVQYLDLAGYIDAMRKVKNPALYVTYNGTEYSVPPEQQTDDSIRGYVMAFNPPELDVFQGAKVVFVPSLEMLRLQVVGYDAASEFPPGFETTFTFSMYIKDDEKKDEDTTGKAPSKNLTVTDFKSSQNMAFRLEKVIKHLDPSAKIVDCTLWKLMDILEGIAFSDESSPEEGVAVE